MPSHIPTVLDLTLLCRHKAPIGVAELMYFFHATHTSVNADPALALENNAQSRQNKIEPEVHAALPASQLCCSEMTSVFSDHAA